MYKNCRDQKTATRQKEIALAAIEVLANNTSKRYSTAQLCEMISIPRRTFYHYFETQDDLFSYCIQYLQDEYVHYDLSVSPVKSSQEALEVNFRFWYQEQNIIRVLIEYGKYYALVYHIGDNLAKNGFGDFVSYYEKGSRTYQLNTRLLVLTIMTIFLDWMDDGFCTPVSIIARSAVELITKPLAKL